MIAVRLKAAEDYDRRHKRHGSRNGALGHVALEVLRALYRFVDFRTGRCEPAIITICQKLRRSKQAVCDAMKRLKEHGFLDWVRRTEKVDNPDAGPQVRQIPNAYGFGLPKCAADWVRKILGSAPVPDCELSRRQAERDGFEAMLEQTSWEEQSAVIAGTDGPIAETLASLARALQQKEERESTERGESLPE